MSTQFYAIDSATPEALSTAVSRVMRTHLNGVLGMTELALSTRLDDQQRLYLTTARASALFLLRCVEALELVGTTESADEPAYR
jgi:signal transduction histidine kinase